MEVKCRPVKFEVLVFKCTWHNLFRIADSWVITYTVAVLMQKPYSCRSYMIIIQLQSISLRKCGISDDPSDYYLAEMIDSSRGEERELDPNELPYNVKTSSYGLIRLYIR